MSRLIAAVAITAAVVSLACNAASDGTSPSLAPTPSDPEQLFQDLLAVYNDATFAVTYRAGGLNDGEAMLSRAEGLLRVDLAQRSGEILVGDSFVIRSFNNLSPLGEGCLWSANLQRVDGRALCERGLNELLTDPYVGLLGNKEFGGFVAVRRILDVDVYCFDVGNFRVSGTICLTDAGIPLQLQTSGRFGTVTMTAIAINEPPAGTDQITTLILRSNDWERYKGVDVMISELRLPELPLVRDFLADADAE